MDPEKGKGVDEVDVKAARKAAKIVRKEEQRGARAIERKEKKQAKAEAKKLKNANSTRSGKWTGDRKAVEKNKKRELATQPENQEKKIKRLNKRAGKLEAEAAKLIESAKKARLQAAALAKQLNAPGKTPSDSNDDTSSSEDESEDEEEKPKKKAQPAKDDSTSSEDNTSSEDESSSESDSESEEEKPKPIKKTKASKADAMEVDSEPKKVEKKRKHEAAESTPKKSENKKSKKSKIEAEAEAEADKGEQWNVQALDGGAARQAKFLKLLGGGKKGADGSSAHTSASQSKADIAQMQSSLENQFNKGMKAKEEGAPRRRGLGA